MPWTTGQRLQGGKYVIDIVLGQGGFGITYKALHIDLNRTVVIKTPNEYLSHDPEYDKYIERFIEEGQILARLSQDPHLHIVGVIDLFQEGAIHCLVMDFVPGENLFQVVRRRGALPEVEIVPCIRQIGEALMVVHQAGLVHRDAHPGNIMVRSNGKAVLIDFGIALEAPKATPPPPVDPVHRKEVVRPKAKLNLEPILDKPATKSPRVIPWGWLIGVLLIYLLIGYLLAASNAPYIIWAVALAVAGALAGDELQKSFSKVHTFLILASTSSLGLALGWLGYRIFQYRF